MVHSISSSDFPLEADQDVAPGLPGGHPIGLGGFHFSADRPENVDFPEGVEGGAIQVTVPLSTGRRPAHETGLRAAKPLGRAAEPALRVEAGGRPRPARPGPGAPGSRPGAGHDSFLPPGPGGDPVPGPGKSSTSPRRFPAAADRRRLSPAQRKSPTSISSSPRRTSRSTPPQSHDLRRSAHIAFGHRPAENGRGGRGYLHLSPFEHDGRLQGHDLAGVEGQGIIVDLGFEPSCLSRHG